MVQKKETMTVDVVLSGAMPEDERPRLALYLLNPAGQVAGKLSPVRQGRLKLRYEWRELGRVIALGPDVEDFRTLGPETLKQFGLEAAWPVWARTERIDIARDKWTKWLLRRFCVSGTVRLCHPRPALSLTATNRRAKATAAIGDPTAAAAPRTVVAASQSETASGKDLVSIFPDARSMPLCNGVVEIYERTCHCRPGIVKEPRRKILPQDQSVPDRPFLQFLPCSYLVRTVGETVVEPDGTFTFCYQRPLELALQRKRCITAYGYKVRQRHENRWVTVYDGPAGHEWFGGAETADLKTCSLLALTCDTDPPFEDQDRRHRCQYGGKRVSGPSAACR